jgi:hypothetical protein
MSRAFVLFVAALACSLAPAAHARKHGKDHGGFDGRAPGSTGKDTYDIVLYAVDGKLQMDQPVESALDPGFHWLQVASTKSNRHGQVTYQPLPLQVAPCTIYRFHAQHERTMSIDHWKIVANGTRVRGDCPPEALAVLASKPQAPAIAADALKPAALGARIDDEGARAVVASLWRDEDAFSLVLDGIETGTDEWLDVAARLLPGADGSASLSLHYAVAYVLSRRPAAVLARVGRGFDLARICTSPYIEPEPGVAETYERVTLAALGKVTEPDLVPLAAQCAEGVRLPVR